MSQQHSAVTCLTACVIEDRFAYMATKLDSLDSEEQVLSRMSFYDARAGEQWFYHDLPGWRVVSVCVHPASAHSPRFVCALSEQGWVELYGRDSSTVEKVADAGLKSSDSPGYGYLNKIRHIGGALYACGVGGQVYRRTASNHWIHLDAGLLQSMVPLNSALQSLAADGDASPLRALPPVLDLVDINGTAESDLYAVGSHGSIFHFDGDRWRRLDVGVDDDLTALHCESRDEVWICGANGYLLTGDARRGFRNVSSVDDNQAFRSIVKFGGAVYLSSGEGVFVYDGKRISTVRTGLKPELLDAHILCADDQRLWSFGFKEIAVFDGVKWTRIRHPDNPAI